MVDRDDDVKLGLKSSAILLGRYDVAAVMVVARAVPRHLAVIGRWQRLGPVTYAGLAVAAGLVALPVPADPRPRPRALLPGIPQQQLGRARGFRRPRARSPLRSQDCSARAAAHMKYRDLRDFLAQLEARGELKRIARDGRSAPRDDRDLRPRAEGGRAGAAVREAQGPFDARARQPVRHVTARRARHGRGSCGARGALRELGRLLATLRRSPSRRKGWKDAWDKLPLLKTGALNGAAGGRARALPGNRARRRGRGPRPAADPDLLAGRRAPLITWGLTVTRGPNQRRQNLGIYRQQVHRPQQSHHALAARSAAARSTTATIAWRIRASRFRWRWRSAPIPPPCWAR